MRMFCLFLLCSALSACAQTAVISTNHYEVLKHETTFGTFGGFAGTMSPGAQSVLALSKQKDAVESFSKLTKEKSPAAQLFGLLELQLTSSNDFNAALPRLLSNKSEARVVVGCMLMQRDVASVAKEIQQGRWRLGLSLNETK